MWSTPYLLTGWHVCQLPSFFSVSQASRLQTRLPPLAKGCWPLCSLFWKRLPLCCCHMLYSSVSWGWWWDGCQLATFSPSTYFPGTPTPSRALLRTVAPLSTVSSCPRSSCSSFIFSYRSMWSGSFFNFQRNFPKTLFKDPSLHPHFLTVMNIFPFYTAFLVISLGLWEGGKETHVFIS